MEGEILLDGVNIKQYSLNKLRHLMGNVTRSLSCSTTNFFNNIAFGVDTTSQEVAEAAKIANAHDFIVATPDGYQSNIGDRGSKLSEGKGKGLA